MSNTRNKSFSFRIDRRRRRRRRRRKRRRGSKEQLTLTLSRVTPCCEKSYVSLVILESLTFRGKRIWIALAKATCLSPSRNDEKRGRRDARRATLSEAMLKNCLNVLHAGEGGSWYGSGGAQPSHSSERSESQEFQGNSMRNRNPFSMVLRSDVNRWKVHRLYISIFFSFLSSFFLSFVFNRKVDLAYAPYENLSLLSNYQKSKDRYFAFRFAKSRRKIISY